MKLNQVLKRIPYWYQAGNDASVYLKSLPGRGKTTILTQASSILSSHLQKNIGHVVINGPLLTPGDAIGYLIPKKNPDGTAESLYTDPFWFRTKDGKRLSDFDGGIIIVDEADKMDTDVKKVIGEAALSGRLGPHQLHGGWVIWMAGNRAQDRSGSTKELDHLINRRMEIDITDDLESYQDWSAKNGMLPITQAFSAQHPRHRVSGQGAGQAGSVVHPAFAVIVRQLPPRGNRRHRGHPG
jgi:MoxR-like ATPase